MLIVGYIEWYGVDEKKKRGGGEAKDEQTIAS